jgi:hypothetical protein
MKTFRSPIRLAVFLSCAGMLALFLFVMFSSPTYGGRRIHYWFEQAVRMNYPEYQVSSCRKAFHAMGDKALPFLLPKSIWHNTSSPFVGFRLVRPFKVPSAEEMHDFWPPGVELD